MFMRWLIAHKLPASLILAMVLIALRQLGASTAAEIVVSIPDQTLALLDGDRVITRYRISTSKFGNGDNVGSYRTSLGTLFVSGKFGDHLPAGTVIKNRAPTREIIGADAPNRDAIISRVIWLRGMERQNSASHDRCIYIHGTPEERHIGKQIARTADDVDFCYGTHQVLFDVNLEIPPRAVT